MAAHGNIIGIQAIEYEIPPQRLDNEPRIAGLNIKRATFEERIGVRRIARKAPEQSTSDLCVRSAEKLFAAHPSVRERADCVVVVTQNPDDAGIPHVSAIVHGKLGLPERCACFDVGLGCSGYVYGLSIVKGFMEANGLRCGLLFTADPYSRIIDENDRSTALLFGDAAAVTLLSDEPAWTIGRFDFGTIGAHGDALQVHLKSNGKLFMNGRAVLAFSEEQVPPSIARAIKSNDLTAEQIDRVVLHQGSRVVVETIAAALNMPGKAAFVAEDYGNTVSSSIPIALARNLEPADRRVAISGFGVGLSWAATVLTRHRK